MIRGLSRLLVLAFLLAAFAAKAATRPPLYLDYIPDDLVTELAEKARNELYRVKLPDGTLVGRESAEERARPLLGFEDLRFIVDAGGLSARAEWCGLDWQRKNFRPLLAFEKERVHPPKTMAYIELLHHTAKRAADNTLRRQTIGCQDYELARLKRVLDDRWRKEPLDFRSDKLS
ncbi:MAG: hypothetical protein IT565_10750 [Rhodospirillales bacterium]|nr:hypothetical protein [Rhodospirillales bacterium]